MADITRLSARRRILLTAYDLFSQRGVRDVTVDEIIRASGVAIATFYRHYSSKNELAAEFLKLRAEVWSTDAVVAESRRRSLNPRARLLAIFDIFDEWFRREDFEGDSFVNVLIEMGPDHPLGQASIEHLGDVRQSVQAIAEEGSLRDPVNFAHTYQILMKGAIIAAMIGDTDAARRTRGVADMLISKHEQ
ncbi:MAG TPA: helix-turn-helix domain-containing protein [Homoserinimonas sp.]|nr:helix-turn-helix domain-containing protein [Homoserinimonas sp.]